MYSPNAISHKNRTFLGPWNP